ncbi:ribosome silencing factor [Helicobacter didelphidarum]|uniref:Ribosomal silencing factor RsfS n=1 Tax=Helicobacter didelphidarum TaxID=2040648 RepID=A0A3D8INZ9_9HELI|nr:ribosome silencing factor [Helicobacter didelphidarum]RDU66969.1 ribosome silencing factor [Helicobacter didelphidarum]
MEKKQEISGQNLVNIIVEILDSKKATHIEIIDLQNKGYLSQFVVIATSMAGKHGLSLLNYLKDDLKPKGVRFYAIDEDNEDWIIVDFGEIIVHIFTENHRNKYNLEEFLEKTFSKNGFNG